MKAIVTIEVDLTKWDLLPGELNSDIVKEIRHYIDEPNLKNMISGRITAVEIYNRENKA